MSEKKEYRQAYLTGERALFQGEHLRIADTIFDGGESPLKESRDIELVGCMFKWKYPLWYARDITAKGCTWFEMGRAGVWYTKHITVEDCAIEAPKNFRRCKNIVLRNVSFPNAAETLWHCDGVTMERITAKGDYFAMNSQHMKVSDLTLYGNYSYVGWWRRRHGFTMEKDWLVFCTGVVPAISSIVRKLTTPAEKVLIQTPVYNIFFNSILNNGRQVLESPLQYKCGQYEIDFDDLEQKLSDPQTSLMILCNPHNPVGKIWDRETLVRIGELCAKHHVTMLSDEIHCDLTDPGTEYVPFASVSETCRDISVTCIAPTKAFNLAGLQTAAVMVPNPTLRHKVWRALNTDEVAEPNAFAVDAVIAAFTSWLIIAIIMIIS